MHTNCEVNDRGAGASDDAPDSEKSIRAQMIERVSQVYRYAPLSIEEALKACLPAWRGKPRVSMLAQLEEVMNRLATKDIVKLQAEI